MAGRIPFGPSSPALIEAFLDISSIYPLLSSLASNNHIYFQLFADLITLLTSYLLIFTYIAFFISILIIFAFIYLRISSFFNFHIFF